MASGTGEHVAGPYLTGATLGGAAVVARPLPGAVAGGVAAGVPVAGLARVVGDRDAGFLARTGGVVVGAALW